MTNHLTHRSMCIDESETPFLDKENLCFYVFKN